MQLEWKRDAVTNKDLATDTLNIIKLLIAAIILSHNQSTQKSYANLVNI